VVAAFLFGCPQPQEPVRLHGQVRLTILHTADLHSRLFPYAFQVGQQDAALGLGAANTIANVGGIARISHIVGRERARAHRVLHLDGGDCFQGAPIFNFFAGEAEMRALAQVGTDAMVIANHEFDLGARNLAKQVNLWSDFPVLAANYLFDDWRLDGNPGVGSLAQPFATFNLDGLRVGVIGMANLSTLSSLFESPNKLGAQPLNTEQVAQFYVDLLRPFTDVIVVLTHLGLEVDERMIENTSGIDVVLGGHNHIVLQPPKVLRDCARSESGNHYIEVADKSAQSESKPSTRERRYCTPRNVLLAHSGAFAKYVGRLDLVVSDTAADVGPGYDPVDKFEVISHAYQLFPVTEEVPEDPRLVALLEPYRQGMDALIDLDLLVGYAPDGSRRSADNGGDAPLGNLVATAAWLRLGVQTDFSLTNTTGLRADMVPGPVSVEQVYNIFPFDNSITKMQLSGVEVQQLFDFVARRSAGRGCKTQAQIAGARVVLSCGDCRREPPAACSSDADCPGSSCDRTTGRCKPLPCAENMYIGVSRVGDQPVRCTKDADCCAPGDTECVKRSFGACGIDPNGIGTCWTPVSLTASYELATSNYLAGGGSGYQVLKRNTTQFDTQVQQRDALIDYIRAGKPCGYDPGFGSPEGLKACSANADCVDARLPGEYVCACTEASRDDVGGSCKTEGTCGSGGRCVLRGCRDDVARYHSALCERAPTPQLEEACRHKDPSKSLGACQLAGEACKYLACVGKRLGNFSDGRVYMMGK
jgi:5'-nucleotidase